MFDGVVASKVGKLLLVNLPYSFEKSNRVAFVLKDNRTDIVHQVEVDFYQELLQYIGSF